MEAASKYGSNANNKENIIIINEMRDIRIKVPVALRNTKAI